MKKPLTLILALILTLSACAGAPSPSPQTDTPSPETASPPAISPSAIPAPPETPPSPEPTPLGWAEAYAAALLGDEPAKPEGAFYSIGDAMGYRLIDLDFDGIPELLFNDLGTVNTPIYAGFTYRSGQVETFWFSDDSTSVFPTDFALYRSLETGTLQWVSHDSYRGGWGEYAYYHTLADFSDLLNPKSTLFCAYRTVAEEVEPDGPGLYDIRSGYDGTPTDDETLDTQYEAVMSHFIYTPSQQITAHRSEVSDLREFFAQWDETIPPPEQTVNPDSLPRIALEYYNQDTTAPYSPRDNYWRQSTLHAIRTQAIAYYADNALDTLDPYGNPEGLSVIRIYSLPDMDALLVVTGDTAFGNPECRLFTYTNETLTPYHNPDVFYERGPCADAIRVINTDQTPAPMLGLYNYTDRTVTLYRITGDTLEYYATETF